MIYRNLYIQIIIRVIILSATCYFFSYEWIRTDHTFTLINLGLLIILQVFFLINYLNRTNRNLTAFLNSIKSGDHMDLQYSLAQNKTYHDLNTCLNEINRAIQKIKIENQVQWEYFQVVVEHVGVGIISFDQHGKIDLYNEAARKILGMNVLNNLDQLNIYRPALYEKFTTTKPGHQETIKIKLDDNENDYALNTIKSIFNDRVITIASLQNITKPLDTKEIESYQKLIRVLTHEIMNSVAPISSLTGSLAKTVKTKRENKELIDDKVIDKTLDGLEIIEKRSKGLSDFVNKFRSVSILKPLTQKEIAVEDMINNITPLFTNSLKDRNVELTLEIEKDLTIYADEQQVEQILINLLKNAIEELDSSEEKQILLSAKNQDSTILIEVKDSGSGISETEMDKIFVPFYTTKSYGSGIGLSISKQIMLAHGGSIKAISKLNEGSTITLSFPQ